MLLTCDIGNTQTVLGLWKTGRLMAACRIFTQSARTEDEFRWIIRQWIAEHQFTESIQDTIYCSVVPGAENAFEKSLQNLVQGVIIKVAHDMILPFTFDYDSPETLGTDRLANAAAGVLFYGQDLIIADFGTAVTFCAISRGVYHGGVIAPGIGTAMESLFQKTSKLPRISLENRQGVSAKTDPVGHTVKNPYQLPGKNTIESLSIGAALGWKGLVKEIVNGLKQLPIWQNPPACLLTGGISENLAFADELFDVIDKNLTLRGLYGLFQLYQN